MVNSHFILILCFSVLIHFVLDTTLTDACYTKRNQVAMKRDFVSFIVSAKISSKSKRMSKVGLCSRRPTLETPIHRKVKENKILLFSSSTTSNDEQSKVMVGWDWDLKGRVRTLFLATVAPFALLAKRLLYLVGSVLSRRKRTGTQDMETAWMRKQTGSFFLRSMEIWGFTIAAFFRWFRLQRIKERSKLIEAQRQMGIWVRESFIELGPTFIKVGQLLSTRIDLFDKEVIEELAALQDQCPKFSTELVMETIGKEFGVPTNQLFDWFDPAPIAAASLGQVHIAQKDGKKYAVKVQRPGLKELFDVDLVNLRVLAQLLDWGDVSGSGTRNWVEVHDQNTELLYKEIDYVNEGENAERFSKNFAKCPWIKVPAIRWDCTSKKVLCMEYLPGIKINNYQELSEAGIDRESIAIRLSQSYLEQLCRHGFFHCDQHPGNLAVRKVGNEDQLIYYDFGMMDELQPEVKKGLVDLFFGLYENEGKEVVKGLGEMGVIRPGADILGLERAIRYFLGEFQKTLVTPAPVTGDKSAEDVKKEIRARRAELGLELLALEKDAPIQFPPAFAFVYRSFATLDGVGKGLSPTYDLTKIAQPYLKGLLDVRDGSAAISVMKTFGKKVGWRPEDIAALVQQSRKIQYLEETIRRLEQGELKLRVRDVAQERSSLRMEITQQSLLGATISSNLLTLAVLLGGPQAKMGRVLLTFAALVGLQVPFGMARLRWMAQKDLEYGVKKNY